jgi:hypothetical protein
MHTGGRDSAVGIATRHRLDGPGIESRWRRGFLHPPGLLNNGWRSLLGIKGGGGVDDPPQSSVEVEERVELYIYSSSVFSLRVMG